MQDAKNRVAHVSDHAQWAYQQFLLSFLGVYGIQHASN